MTWSRFDDAARHHPKAVIAGNEAWALWAATIMHCNQFLTDGFVSDAALPTVLPNPISKAKAHRLAAILCEARATPDSCGLFERDDTRGGYVVHDFLSWNPSKAQIESKREKDRLRKDAERNPRVVRADNIRTPRGQHSDSPAPAGGGAPAPDPSPAQPSPANLLSSSLPATTPAAPLSASADEPEARNSKTSAVVARVFEAWKLDTGHARAKLDPKRRKRIEARLREGLTEQDLLDAIEGRHEDPWLMGKNPDGRLYDELETLFRDCAQVERLRDIRRGLRTPKAVPRQPTLTAEDFE